MEIYFLSSMESEMLSYVRKCSYIKKIKFDTGKDAVIAEIDNSVQWKTTDGKYHASDKIILTARHENFEIFDIESYPTFVYVTVLKDRDYDFVEEVTKDDLIILGIGELYKTRENAENHIFSL